MPHDPETTYRRFGRLLEGLPHLSPNGSLTPQQHEWIGRAGALVHQCGDISDKATWNVQVQNLSTTNRIWAFETMLTIFYRLMASAELAAPAGAQGSFIPAGGAFDALGAISKLMRTASRDLLIIDPYLDESILTDFSGGISDQVNLRLLSDVATHKATLIPAVNKWKAQYGAQRPLELRLAPSRSLHDRAVLVDGDRAWILTQSFKDFANRAPGEVVRSDHTAAMKIPAYEAIWAGSTPTG
jgi:hypothetical protein